MLAVLALAVVVSPRVHLAGLGLMALACMGFTAALSGAYIIFPKWDDDELRPQPGGLRFTPTLMLVAGSWAGILGLAFGLVYLSTTWNLGRASFSFR